MRIEALRRLVQGEEVDYQFLIAALQSYSSPRDKISDWLASGDLIRVKKGLYVFGKSIAQGPYSKEILANLIYGPSAISLSYALAFYGLIPERVETITSITHKRNKQFSTPVGNFTYHYLSQKKYSVGIELKTTASNRQFFIAAPEKALCDQISVVDKHLSLDTKSAMEKYLFADLRIDEDGLRKFDIEKLTAIAECYRHNKINILTKFIIDWKNKQ